MHLIKTPNFKSLKLGNPKTTLINANINQFMTILLSSLKLTI